MRPCPSLDAATFADLYRGRRVLVVGATGFLGSVTLSLLMNELPVIERLVVLVRKTPGQTARSRFDERVLPGPAFDPLRERFGEALAPLLEAKLRVVQGDISQADLGFDAETLATIEAEGGLDLILNGSGLVDFHAPLEQAYKVNILGTLNLLAAARRFGARLVHTSTCYVAGSRVGNVPETIVPGDFPRRAELPYLAFDAEHELADIATEIELLRARSLTLETRARLTEQAVNRFREVNASDPTAPQLANALKRAQRDWLAAEGVEAGRRRAAFWGWPNVYTYSKAIAEQLLLAATDVVTAVVRPAIIESALAYPLPGWNQNATTSAPLVMLALAGFEHVPARAEHVLDVVPVDQVAWALLAAGGAAIANQAEAVYQVGTSATNPLTMRRVVDLIGLYLHDRALDEPKPDAASGVKRWLAASREPRMVDATTFKRRADFVDALSQKLASACEDAQGHVGHHRARAWLARLEGKAHEAHDELERAIGLWDVFMPFSHDYAYRFESGHLQALAARLAPAASAVAYAPEAIDWRHYWLEIHIPGLQRWVLADASSKAVKPLQAATTLLAKIEGVAARDGFRSALAYLVGDVPFALTYAQLWGASGALAATLAAQHLAPGTPLGVMTDARTAWPVALLGALRAGHPVVLVRPRTPSAMRPNANTAAVIAVTGPNAGVLTRPGAADEPLAWGSRDDAPPAPQGLSTQGSHPQVAALVETPAGWQLASALDARALADRLHPMGDWWGLSAQDSVLAVLPEGDSSASDAFALATLGVLYHQASLDVIAANDWADALDGLAPTSLILSEAAWEAAPEGLNFLQRVERVLDCAPLARPVERDRFLAAGTAVIQALWEPAGLAFVAGRRLENAQDLPSFAALAPWRVQASLDGTTLQFGTGAKGGWRDTAWHAHALAAGFRLDGDAASGPEGRALAALRAAVALDALALLPAAPGESGRRALVVPTLGTASSFQPLRRRLLEAVRAHNADVPLAERIHRLGVTLAPWSGDPDALPTPVLWLDARVKPRFDEAPDVEALLAEDLELLAGRLGTDALENALAPLRDEALTYERLLAWERALLRAAHEGNWTTQGLMQAFGQEDAKHRRLDYRAARAAGAVIQRVRDWTADENPDTNLLPEPVSEAVRGALGAASMAFYRHGLVVHVRGSAYVPPGENFLVVANHSSHLDGGLVKYAIGAWGNRLHTLAAKDYFFGGPARRLMAHHFTHLIPTDRHKVTSEWLRRARDVLALGDCVLIFPEGTRSTTDELQPFKASLGTLIRSARVPVLPVRLEGTRAILPKGHFLPRGREVTVHIGPPIPVASWEAVGAERGALGQDKEIASYLQAAVESLPSGNFFWLPGQEERRVLAPAPEVRA